MQLAPFGEEMQRLAGDTADVSLNFRVPFGERPTTVLSARSEFAQLDIRAEPDTVEVAATIQGALEVRADLDRDDDGSLSGNGTLQVASANELLTLLAPDSGVPL